VGELVVVDVVGELKRDAQGHAKFTHGVLDRIVGIGSNGPQLGRRSEKGPRLGCVYSLDLEKARFLGVYVDIPRLTCE